MFKNTNIYKTIVIILVLLSTTIHAEIVYKTANIPECNDDIHYNKDINTSKYIEYLYNKLDLTNAGTILGQYIKYSPTKTHLKDYFPDLRSSKTIIENKENKELWLEDENFLITFKILNIENSVMTVEQFNQAKQGTYMTQSVIEIDMSDDSVRYLGLCYAR